MNKKLVLLISMLSGPPASTKSHIVSLRI